MGLFSKKDKKSTADASDNPYAQQQPPADHISQQSPMATYGARAGLPSGPRPGGGLPGGPSPRGYGGSPAPRQSPQSNAGGYGTPNAPSNAGGYGNDRQGYSGGYGGNRYNTSGEMGQGQSRPTGYGQRGPGGYGGMGGGSRYGGQDEPDAARDELFGSNAQADPPAENRYRQPAAAAPGAGSGYSRPMRDDKDANRGELFSGARDRHAPTQQGGPGDMYGGGQSGVSGDSYGGYGEQRELTEEEKADMEYEGLRDETKRVRQEGIDSLDRSINVAQGAVDTMTATLARLGYQEDMLDNAQRTFTNAKYKSEEAHGNVRDLQRINSSMLSSLQPSFKRKKRLQMEDERNERLRKEADGERAANRAEYYAAQQHTSNTINQIHSMQPDYDDGDMAATREKVRKQNNKYLFDDADDEDIEQEVQVEDRLQKLSLMSAQLNVGGRAMGTVVDRQNKKMDKMTDTVERTGDSIHKNKNLLNKIR